MGKDQVVIPGCEPTSTITSDVLLRFQRCCGATVPLDRALEAIPGSRVEFQTNNGIFAGYRKRWFVLPPIALDCECVQYPDYYQILKDLACETTQEEPVADCGEPIDMGYCPAPGFEDALPPPVYPYVDEGNSPYGDITDFVHTWPYHVALH